MFRFNETLFAFICKFVLISHREKNISSHVHINQIAKIVHNIIIIKNDLIKLIKIRMLKYT